MTEALDALTAAEAVESQPSKEHFIQADSGALQPASTPSKETNTPPDLTTDTPAAVETKPAEATQTPKTEEPAKPDNRSKFTQNAERLDKTWKAVNERKTLLDTQETSLKDREAKIVHREQQLEVKAAKARQTKPPEEYEAASKRSTDTANQLELQALGLERRAEQFESDGKYTEAESAKQRAQEMREQAGEEKLAAKQLVRHAQYLRQNPDPTLQQMQQKNAQALQHYTMEAAKKYPEVFKEGSPVFDNVKQLIGEARQAGLDENEYPIVRFFVARLADAESKAARVSGLEKSEGELKAKVKELEKLTSPGGGNPSVQHQERAKVAPTDAEEEESLRQEAISRGVIPRG